MFSKERVKDRAHIKKLEEKEIELDLKIAKLCQQEEEKIRKIAELEEQVAAQNTSRPNMA
jgi:hypothetical protein